MVMFMVVVHMVLLMVLRIMEVLLQILKSVKGLENVPEDLEKIEFRYDWYGDGKETISLTEGREVAE